MGFTPFNFDSPIVAGRVQLGLMVGSDVDAVYAWMSDEEVVRYQMYEPRTRSEVVDRLTEYAEARQLEKVGDYIQPAIVVDGLVVGLIYFKISSLEDLTGEIGWALAREHQGQGFAFEAAGAILELGFGVLGLHRIFAELDPRNAASIALCSRLGMRHEAHLVENILFKGDWADTAIYAILGHEWTMNDSPRMTERAPTSGTPGPLLIDLLLERHPEATTCRVSRYSEKQQPARNRQAEK